MSEELKPAAVHDANVFLPGSLGPVRREVVLAYEHDRVVNQLRAELAALKAGQGEAVAIKSHGAWDGLDVLADLPDGTHLYTAPPASADARLVPVELLERVVSQFEDDCKSFSYDIDDIRALLAQSESKG